MAPVPTMPDTDDDGLSDREELALGRSIYDEMRVHCHHALVRPDAGALSLVACSGRLSQSTAAQSRRRPPQGLAGEGKLSSPNAYDALPVGEALGLSIGQTFTNGGGTSITVSSSFWPNDEAAGLDATLTITLPVPFSDVALNAMLFPPLVLPGFDVRHPARLRANVCPMVPSAHDPGS